jgi:peptide/nickel transport system substrate-binding protein
MTNFANVTKRLMMLGTMSIASAALVTSASVAQTPKRGGAIVEGLEADFPSLDLVRISALAEREVSLSIYDPLFDVNAKGEVAPYLAESFTVSSDAKVYTIKLRPNVKFHDGTPFDADAVIFNLDRDRDPQSACRCSGQIEIIDHERAIDPLTVEVTLKRPSATLPALLTDTPGMMASPTAVKKDPAAFGNHPVGTGPFVFKEWVKGDHMTFTRNPDYWNKPLPYVDQVTYRPIPNEESRESTLVANGININQNPGPKSIVDAKKNPSLRVTKPEALGTLFIMMNTKTGPTADVRVRQAMAYATDSALIDKAIYYNLYDLVQSPFPRGSSAYQEHVAGFPAFDLKKAQGLIKQVGKPVEITLSIDNTPNTVRLGEILQAMWGKAGIKTKIASFEQHRLIENALTKSYQAEIYRWAGRPDPDPNVYKFFYSKYADERSSNYTAYSNPDMDRLLDEGAQTLDTEKRKDIYRQVSELLAKDSPYAFMFEANFFSISSSKVQGIEAVPDGLIRLRNVWLEQ